MKRSTASIAPSSPPFDREDIHALVGELDDIIDATDAVAKRFNLYHIKSLAPEFKKQCENLVAATIALREAVHCLRKSYKLSNMQEKLIELHRCENQGDDTNHAAMSRLFEGGVEPLEVIKWKNIFDLIEEAINGCEGRRQYARAHCAEERVTAGRVPKHH